MNHEQLDLAKHALSAFLGDMDLDLSDKITGLSELYAEMGITLSTLSDIQHISDTVQEEA